MITWCEPAHAWADRIDDTRPFMPADQRKPGDHVALLGVVVRVTEPRGRQPDADLAKLSIVELGLLNDPRRMGRPQNGST